MKPTCAFCGRDVNPESFLTYRKVVGWERRRVEGGTNALALRKPLDVFACEVCIGRLRRGLDPGQGTLL